MIRMIGMVGRLRLDFGLGFGFAGFALQAAGQRLQQEAGVLKVAPPQQGRAFAGETVGRVGADRIVHADHAARRVGAGFATP